MTKAHLPPESVALLQKLSRISLILSYLAIAVFLIMGTLSVLNTSEAMSSFYYVGFVQVPVLIAYLTVPLSLLCVFALLRQGVLPRGMVISFIVMAFLLTAYFRLSGESSWIGAAAWISLVFWLKESIRRYSAFVEGKMTTIEG